MKRRIQIMVAAVATLATLLSCDRYEGDVVEPSYLKIDSIYVVDNSQTSWSNESGFFTSAVDAVNVVVWAEGDAAETNLGTFQLPCTVPVLKRGNVDMVRISPVVKQDGIAGKRITYPYYQDITLEDVRFVTDSVTDLGTLTTQFAPGMKVLWREFFEPGPNEISLDSVVQRCYSLDTVRWGYGCGRVHIADSVTRLAFWSDTTYTIPSASSIVYLEMDYWSDVDFTVALYNPTTSGGTNVLINHMTIYGKPEQGWQKIYINIGGTWSRHSGHYPDIRPYFYILNDGAQSGNLYIDNIKLIVI